MEKRIPYIGAVASFILFLAILFWPGNSADTANTGSSMSVGTEATTKLENSPLSYRASSRLPSAESADSGSDLLAAFESSTTSTGVTITGTSAAAGSRPSTSTAASTTTAVPIGSTTITSTNHDHTPTDHDHHDSPSHDHHHDCPNDDHDSRTDNHHHGRANDDHGRTDNHHHRRPNDDPGADYYDHSLRVQGRHNPGGIDHHFVSTRRSTSRVGHPLLGFEVKIHDNGPSRVVVVFELDDLSFRITARWIQGVLDVTVDTDDD